MKADDFERISALTAQTAYEHRRVQVHDPQARAPRWEELTDQQRREQIRAVSAAVTFAIPHAVAAAYYHDAQTLTDPGDSHFRFLTEQLTALAASYDAMAAPLDPEHEDPATVERDHTFRQATTADHDGEPGAR